jgi:hypothetical protein
VLITIKFPLGDKNIFCDGRHISDFQNTLHRPIPVGQEGQMAARVNIETAWQDIATAPRDGQRFVALNIKSHAMYYCFWSPERQCFVNTKTKNRINPTHWDGLEDEL